MLTHKQEILLNVIMEKGSCASIKNIGNFNWNYINCHDCPFFRKECDNGDDIQQKSEQLLKLDKIQKILE